MLILFFNQKSSWVKAKKLNSYDSYQAYLNEYHSEGRYADEAYKMIHKLDSMRTVKEDSIAMIEKIREDSIAYAYSLVTSPRNTSSLTIKGNKVNIRSYPSLQSGVTMQLNTGDVCEILEKGNLENINGIADYWYKINFNSKIGWVYGNFTNLTTNSTGSIYGKYPMTSLRNLTSSDLSGMSLWDLKIMRNEIFARHGYIFKTQDMKSYFESQSWYRGQYSDVTSMLTDIEKQNIELIKRYE